VTKISVTLFKQKVKKQMLDQQNLEVNIVNDTLFFDVVSTINWFFDIWCSCSYTT